MEKSCIVSDTRHCFEYMGKCIQSNYQKQRNDSSCISKFYQCRRTVNEKMKKK